jgi:predicted transcriptional regulator
VATLSLGRRATKITVIEVCDALLLHQNVSEAADRLGCSRALVYKILKSNGLVLGNFVKKEGTDRKHIE